VSGGYVGNTIFSTGTGIDIVIKSMGTTYIQYDYNLQMCCIAVKFIFDMALADWTVSVKANGNLISFIMPYVKVGFCFFNRKTYPKLSSLRNANTCLQQKLLLFMDC
jgi:hypothetical protein